MPRAAAPKKSKPAPSKMGRPPKGGTTAGRLMSVRLTDEDGAMLDALVSDEREKLKASGSMATVAARVAAADVLRALIRQEAGRRGLQPAA